MTHNDRVLRRRAVAGGAAAIRANGPADIRAIRRHHTCCPIIGIQKVRRPRWKYFLSRRLSSQQRHSLKLGADMVALDCTARGQQSGAFDRDSRNSTPG